ncbi:NIPBL protein, partial [Cardinalis cardinalis]|nr:NIPBL protein [Cardinalis cardinalis]
QVSGGDDEIQQLQKALLDYLDENTEIDASLVVNFSFLSSGMYINNFSNMYRIKFFFIIFISGSVKLMNSDTVDYEDACLIVRYLASMRPFAQSFDIYLTQ